MATDITLIWLRHGDKAYANGKGPAGAPAYDPPLTEEAPAKIQALGQTLVSAYGVPLYCLTSPYRRTRETAKNLLLAPQLQVTKPVQQYTDVNVAEYLGNHPATGSGAVIPPAVMPETLTSAGHTLPPFGEPFAALKERCRKHLELFHLPNFKNGPATPGFTIWVVTHGVVLDQIIKQLRDLALSCRLAIEIPTKWDAKPLDYIILRGQYGAGATLRASSIPVALPGMLLGPLPLPSIGSGPATLPGGTETKGPSAEVLDKEYANWQLTLSLLTRLNAHIDRDRREPKRSRDKKKYEASNILERWLLSTVNAAGGQLYTDGPPLRFGEKLAGELVDKKIMTAAEAATFAAQLQTVKPTVKITGFVPALSGETITYGPQFKIALTPRLRALLAFTSIGDVTWMLLRYAALISGSQHWGLTQEHANELYVDFNVRNEGFASPPNSRYAGKFEASFCSIAPDTDRVFGSKGNFFDVDMLSLKGNWGVNPPFIDELDTQVAQKILSTHARAKAANQPLLTFSLLPAWANTDFHTLLSKSEHLVTMVRLERGRYHFELPDSTKIIAQVDCFYYCHSALPPSASEKGRIETMMLRLNSKTPLTT